MELTQEATAEPVVMLLHGMFGAANNWKVCASRLGGRWKVRVPEMPVLDLPREETGVPALVDHIRDLLDREGISRVVLGGNSLGGHVALALALKYPKRVAALMLIGSSGLFDRGFNRGVPRRPTREWIRNKMREVFFEESNITEDLINEVHGTLSNPGQVRKVLRMAESAKHDNLRESLPRLHCPILLIWGAEDQITPFSMAYEFKNCLPQAEMAIIDRCGHSPNIERPAEVSGIMEQFLASHFTRQGEDGNATAADSGRPALVEARGLCRTFDGGNVQALRGADFAIGEGELVAVVGPSGCGKSTLLQLLGALDRPTGGDVLFRGRPLSAIRDLPGFRARAIGFIFQSFHLLPTLTALENVQMPMFEMPWPASERRRRAEDLLKAVGLGDRKDHLPAKLSGGERQRVAIARSLANEPELLLADEPTGNLDSQSATAVLDLLQHIHEQRGMTVVVVTHDPSVAGVADRILRMLDGRIVADTGLRVEAK